MHFDERTALQILLLVSLCIQVICTNQMSGRRLQELYLVLEYTLYIERAMTGIDSINRIADHVNLVSVVCIFKLVILV